MSRSETAAMVGMVCVCLLSGLLAAPMPVWADSADHHTDPDSTVEPSLKHQPTENIIPANYPEDGLMINIAARFLVVVENGEVLRRYPVAAGRPETPTPRGQFEIVNRVSDPWWYPKGKEPVPAGPDNPLGPWWMGLDKSGYGIHGNNASSSIGRLASQGCVRMANADVSELVEMVDTGTFVNIVYESVAPVPVVDDKGSSWHLGIYPDPYGLSNASVSTRIQRLLDEGNLYLPPESMLAVRNIMEDDGHALPAEVPLGRLPGQMGEEAAVAGIPWFFDDQLMPTAALQADHGETLLPLGTLLQRIYQLSGEKPDIEIAGEDLSPEKRSMECEVADGKLVKLGTGDFLSCEMLLSKNQSRCADINDEYGEREEMLAVEVVLTSTEKYGGLLKDAKVALSAWLHQQRVYVGLSEIGDHVHLVTDSTPWGAWVQSARFYLADQLAAVHSPFPGEEAGLIPVSVLQHIFGRRVVWRDDEITFIRQKLQNVQWVDGEPWVRGADIADILGWDKEVTNFSVRLLPPSHSTGR